MLEHIFIRLPKLETNRLILRKLEYSDKSDIFEYAQNPNVAKYVLWEPHQDELDTLEFLNMVYASYNKNKAAPWGIQIKNDSKIIGTIGFIHWYIDKKEAEVGYALAEKYWNNGFVTEALEKVLDFGFEKMNLNKITARCLPENSASIKVLEKSGFKFEDKSKMFVKGKLTSINFYSLEK